MNRFIRRTSDRRFVLGVIAGWMFCYCATTVGAANIWLTSSNNLPAGSTPPLNPPEIPQVSRGLGSAGSFYIWGTPDAGKTLSNWSLNIVSSNPEVLQFTTTDVQSFNPVLDPLANKSRWEYVGEPATPEGSVSSPRLDGIQGFSIGIPGAGNTGIGIGTGAGAAGGSMVPDPFAANNSWLIARVDYLTGTTEGAAEVSLQMGSAGINHLGEESALTDVVFGALTDPALNAGNASGQTGREKNSETPELVFTVADTGQQNADFDADSDVDGSDFLTWQRGYGTSSGIGDANNDQLTDGADLVIWEQQFGSPQNNTAAASLAVPEPSTGMLWAFAISLLIVGSQHEIRLRRIFFTESVSGYDGKLA